MQTLEARFLLPQSLLEHQKLSQTLDCRQKSDSERIVFRQLCDQQFMVAIGVPPRFAPNIRQNVPSIHNLREDWMLEQVRYG